MNTYEFMRDVDRGFNEVQLSEKHRLSTSEVRVFMMELRKVRKEALHNRVKGMFLMGHTIAELPKYFGLTEPQIRAILQPDKPS